MRALLVTLLLAGCDNVFSTKLPDARAVDVCPPDPSEDLDGDCIADAVDPCIAPPDELLADEDGDGIATIDDACPFDMVDGMNGDGDELGDACDPSTQRGGTRRCAMTFSSSTLNSALWADLADTRIAWTAPGGALVYRAHPDDPSRLATMLPTRPLAVDQTTTIDVRVVVHDATVMATAGFYLWLSAYEQDPGEAEASGCIVYSTTNNTLLVRAAGSGPENPKMFGAFASAFTMRVRGTFVVGAATTLVRCAARLADDPTWVETESQIDVGTPPGVPGVGARFWPLEVDQLAIIVHP